MESWSRKKCFITASPPVTIGAANEVPSTRAIRWTFRAAVKAGSGIGGQNALARGREAPLGRTAAAIRELGDGSVFACGDDREAVAPHLLDVHGKAGQDTDGVRVDLAPAELACTGLGAERAFGLALHAPGLAPGAARSVRISSPPDEDGLFTGVRLREHFDRLAVVGAQSRLRVVVDESGVLEAEVEKVEPPARTFPGEDVPEHGGALGVLAPELRERHGVEVLGLRLHSERDREDREVGTPRHAVRDIGVGQGRPGGGNHARDRGAVRELVAGLVGRTLQQLFGDRGPLEHRVRLVDAGIDDADGLALARPYVVTLDEGEVRVRLVGLDRRETPLLEKVRPAPDLPGEGKSPSPRPARAEGILPHGWRCMSPHRPAHCHRRPRRARTPPSTRRGCGQARGWPSGGRPAR